MAIPLLMDAFRSLRNDPPRLVLIGLVVGGGCLCVGLRSSPVSVSHDAVNLAEPSRSAITQVSHELDLDVELLRMPGDAYPVLQSPTRSQVVPAVAIVDIDGPGGAAAIRQVEPVANSFREDSMPTASFARTSGPARLIGTIEVVE
jgi:hypothetical protein